MLLAIVTPFNLIAVKLEAVKDVPVIVLACATAETPVKPVLLLIAAALAIALADLVEPAEEVSEDMSSDANAAPITTPLSFKLLSSNRPVVPVAGAIAAVARVVVTTCEVLAA